ncbi:replication initiation protein [Microcoleus sp. herbarium14]
MRKDKPAMVLFENSLNRIAVNLSKLQRNLFYMVCSQIQPDHTAETVYEISATELMKRTGDMVNYARLRQQTLQLIQPKEFEMPSERKDKQGNPYKNVLQTGLFASALYLEGEGTVQLTISAHVRPFILNFSQKLKGGNFSQLDVDLVLALRSKYGQAMYQQLTQWRFHADKGHTYTLEELKTLLGVIDKNGFDKYAKWSFFDKEVLKPAQKDLEKTDMQFTYTPIPTPKRGRGNKVTHVKFLLSTDDDRNFPPGFVIGEEHKTLFDRLVDQFGLRKDQAQNVILNFDIKDINKRLYDLQIQNNNNKIGNLGAYTAKSFGV